MPASAYTRSTQLEYTLLSETASICAEGTVDQVGPDYIGLKVLGGLVAVLHEDELQRTLQYSAAVSLNFLLKCPFAAPNNLAFVLCVDSLKAKHVATQE